MAVFVTSRSVKFPTKKLHVGHKMTHVRRTTGVIAKHETSLIRKSLVVFGRTSALNDKTTAKKTVDDEVGVVVEEEKIKESRPALIETVVFVAPPVQ